MIEYRRLGARAQDDREVINVLSKQVTVFHLKPSKIAIDSKLGKW